MNAWQVVTWMVGLVVALFLLIKILRDPAYAILRVIKGFLVGVIALLAINWVGTAIHLHIPLNPVTALIAGILGIPGIAALLVMQMWILNG
jgi:inhibitor of the pro-sigma K processing machinery